jgi:hypothetical protein
MNRCLALIGALILAFISVSSACTAAPAQWIHFTLEPANDGSDTIRAEFRSDRREHGENDWSTGFRPSGLAGLDVAGFRGAGSRPVSFAVIRDPGRLDCSGQGGRSHATGYCSFSADGRFTQLLESRGIGHPTNEQSFSLMAVNARRELIDAVSAARYPTPTIDNLIALSALDVDGAYISGMASAGYTPRTLDSLIQFKALNITPGWISGFARIGYANVPAEELVQLKALDITPEFIAGFDRIGYRHLPIEKLVELKAMDITPEFVRTVAGGAASMPPINKLVELKLFGGRR